ncbi:MAG: hypothetical protein ACREV5_02715 [Steroidobacter sp.]
MKTRIALGAGLLLTLGTAVAGTLMFGQSHSTHLDAYQPNVASIDARDVTPEMIAMWKATAVSTDYISPKVPI